MAAVIVTCPTITLDDNAITMPNLLRAAGAMLVGDSLGQKPLDTSDAGCNAKDAAVSIALLLA